MEKMDWKKKAPRIIVIGIGVLVIGVVAFAKIKGECPFAMCANAVAPRPPAAAVHSPDGKTIASSDWTTDFQAAQEAAKRENKILFLSFGGSDWCPWCMRLDEEVLSKTEFLTWAKANAILVQIDFPRNIAQPEELKKQNEALARAYGVEGFPTVILAGNDGGAIARTGYRRGGAANYVKHLEQIQHKGAEK